MDKIELNVVIIEQEEVAILTQNNSFFQNLKINKIIGRVVKYSFLI